MKKILLLLVIFVPLCAFSQTKKSIDSFFDIPFGSDSTTVKKIFAGKGAFKVDTSSEKDFLVFQNVKLGDRKVFYCEVWFIDNKAYQADFILDDFAEKEALNYYDDLSRDLTAIYGKGDFQSNFGEARNTARIRSVKSGNGFCRTIWRSKNKNNVGIEIKYITNSVEILLQYRSYELWQLSNTKKRSDL